MLCVAIFTASSLLCGLSTSLPMLIVFRVLQGLGAPSEQAILADTFPPPKRAQAFALYGVAVIVAPTVGPTLGGWITDNFSWHWIFFINVPVGALSLSLVQWLVVEPDVLQRERRQRLAGGLKVDWAGFVLVALCLGCLELVLDTGQRDDWFASGFVVTFSAISASAGISLIPWELTRKDPIVDIRLLFRRQFGASVLVMMAVGAVLFGSTQLLPQLLQINFGYTAELSGLALMPGGFAMLLLMPIAGQAANLIQPKYLIASGMLIIAMAMWHLTSLVPDADFGYFAWARVGQMIGLPLLFVPINTIAYAGLPPEKTSQASALINVARNLGGSIGISLANTMLAQRSQFHQVRLTENLIPSSLTYQEAIRHVTEFFISQGASLVNAQHLAIAWVGQIVQSQASLLAYIDVFWACAIFAGLMVPLALLLLLPIDRDVTHIAH
jgi:DHA2 family multidrug resistance protein